MASSSSVVGDPIVVGQRIMRPAIVSHERRFFQRKRRRVIIGDRRRFTETKWVLSLFALTLILTPCGSQSIGNATSTPTAIPISPTLAPTARATPTQTPGTAFPTPTPTISLFPTESPTLSQEPTISPQPSQIPTNVPTGPPTPFPTPGPTVTPTVSPLPTMLPSVNPSSPPTISFKPSMNPSISSAPSTSTAPSFLPSAPPSISSPPTEVPSAFPSFVPSSMPSTSFPTQAPTPVVDRQQNATLSITVFGMNQSVETISGKRFALITSEHVRNFWRGFGRERGLFYVRKVTTLFEEERELPSRNNDGYPPPRNIKFTVSMDYRVRDLDLPGALEEVQRLVGRDLGADRMEEYIYRWRGMFTLPFEQDSLRYLLSLDQELVNNTNFLWLEFEGVEDPNARQRKVIISSFSAIVVALALAGACYYFYTTRILDDDAIISPTGSDSPIVGAVIGVNAREDILISESYDDDFVHFGASHQNESLLGRHNSRHEDDMELPLELVKEVGPTSSPATALSDIETPNSERAKASPSQGTAFSVGTNMSGRTPSQAEVVSATESGEVEPPPDDASNGGSSACAPSFIGDFQMEIQDLED